MSEVFVSRPRRVFLACLCIIEVVACGAAPHMTVIILSFYEVVLTFPKLGCWPGRGTCQPLLMPLCHVVDIKHTHIFNTSFEMVCSLKPHLSNKPVWNWVVQCICPVYSTMPCNVNKAQHSELSFNFSVSCHLLVRNKTFHRVVPCLFQVCINATLAICKSCCKLPSNPSGCEV